MAAVARLARRADFVAARKGRRVESRCFTLQSALRRSADKPRADEPNSARVGFTITKKVGGAVERNRIRRRLREAIRRASDIPFRDDCDYVLVARREALDEPFAALQDAVAKAVAAAHAPRPDRPISRRVSARSDRSSP
jgi:ribonuclease P protein component